jgi:non-ribosomal peptide synthase protein (TIGR01720 family)
VFGAVDLSRTVGWFTSLYPVRLDVSGQAVEEALAGGASLGGLFKSVKEQLRGLPRRGLGYGLLRYLNEETAGELAGLASPQLSFNYLGRFASGGDSDWSGAGDGEGLSVIDAEQPLSHVIAVDAITLDGAHGSELVANWTWAPSLISAAQVRAQPKRPCAGCAVTDLDRAAGAGLSGDRGHPAGDAAAGGSVIPRAV